MSDNIFKRLYSSGAGLVITILVGTLGYWVILEQNYTLFDCFFMTFITVTTIGFGEVIPLDQYYGARLFTVVIALSGIGFITYFVSTLAGTIIEGYFKENYQKSKRNKMIGKLDNHYILCGVNPYTNKIIEELAVTSRDHVIIDTDVEKIAKVIERFKDEYYIEGDATEDDILKTAGIEKARGVFAATEDDNVNLVISLSAKRLNPSARVVAFCFNHKNAEKLMLAGADKVVSPTNIGGMRLASEMIRPTVTNFLDFMLREDSKTFRIEEIPISDNHHGKKIIEIDVSGLNSTLIMAIRSGDSWKFKPDNEYCVSEGDILVVMTTPEERHKLENML